MFFKLMTLLLPLFFFFFLVQCMPALPGEGSSDTKLTVNLGRVNLTCMLKLAEFDRPCVAQLGPSFKPKSTNITYDRPMCCHFANYTSCVQSKVEADTACRDFLRSMVSTIIGAIRSKCGTLMDNCSS